MTDLVGQERNLALLDRNRQFTVISRWSIPIPIAEYSNSPVVVYFYSERWIPISCFSLAEAIALYRKALSLGKKILVYPPDLDGDIQGTFSPE